jgi:thioredoxin 1
MHMAITHIDMESFDKEVRDSRLPVLIDFYADWCGPCKMLAPAFEELSSEYEGRLKFAKLNTDHAQPLAMEFRVSGIPCLILTSKGDEIGRIVGYLPKPALKAKIDALLAVAKK